MAAAAKRGLGIAAVVVLLALAGCSGSSFEGSVAGHSLEVEEALLITGSDATGTFAHVHLVDRTDVCKQVRDGHQPSGMTSFVLMFAGSGQSPVGPGDYVVAAPDALPVAGHVVAEFFKTDTACQSVMAGRGFGVSGHVVLDSIDSESAEGAFDLVFDTGDHVTGDFSADACTGAQAEVTCH